MVGVCAADGEDEDAGEEEQGRDEEDEDAAVDGGGVAGVAGGFVAERAALSKGGRR